MECRNHPAAPAADRCAGCQEPFCDNCLVTVRGRKYCGSCKVMALGSQTPVFESATEVCAEANEALKYAIVGLFCCGIILEPIAINKAIKAKREIAENPNLTGEGRATAALVIGILGLVLWVISIIVRINR
jgi:Domain of unknown function (DUF4190)